MIQSSRRRNGSAILLCLCLGISSVDAAHAREPYRGLRASLATTATVESDNELLRILELVAKLWKEKGSRFETLNVAPSSTKGGGAQLILPDPSLAEHELIAWLAPQVAQRLAEPLDRPAPCGNVNCCQRMADLTCVRSYPIGESLFGSFDVLLVAFDSLAMELAAKSRILDLQALRARSLEGDTTWWVWPVQPSPSSYLMTKVDVELMDRLVTSSSELEKLIARACPGTLDGSARTSCSRGGFGHGCSGAPRATITVSTGEASRARSLEPLGSTVEAVVRDSCLELRRLNSTGQRGIQDWHSKADVFLNRGGGACLGAEMKDALDLERRALGRPDVGIFFFYSLYLRGVWEEVADSGLDPFSCSG